MAKSWRVLAVTATLLLLAGCGAHPAAPPSPPAAAAPPAATVPPTTPTPTAGKGALDVADESLAGVYLGEAAFKAKADLGDPARHRLSAQGAIDFWDYNSGMSIYVDGRQGMVWGIRVEKQWSGQTPRGLKLGDSEARLLELYGNPNYHGKSIWIASNHAYVNDKTLLAISFDVNAGKVTGIQVLRLPDSTQANSRS